MMVSSGNEKGRHYAAVRATDGAGTAAFQEPVTNRPQTDQDPAKSRLQRMRSAHCRA